MDKVTLEFKTPKVVKIEYNDVLIEVKPYISINEQIALAQIYVDAYFNLNNVEVLIKNTKYDLFSAEYNLIHSVIQLTTNIDSECLDTDMYDGSKLWEDIKGKIVNYYEFRENLDIVVRDIKEERLEKYSIGNVITEFLEKITNTLNNFSNFTPDDIEKVKQSGLDLLKEIEKSTIPNVLSEVKINKSIKQKKSKKQ